jgi:hypothetical protein
MSSEEPPTDVEGLAPAFISGVFGVISPFQGI